MALTSTDYGRLLQFFALKNQGRILNKTQVNKVLFYVYGVHLALTGQKLFADDAPQAWLYGPVFPRVYRYTDSDEMVRTLTSEQKSAFMEDSETLVKIRDVVGRMAYKTATQLVLWSHRVDSPWSKTLYTLKDDGTIEQKPWSTPIDENYIKEYFGKAENRIYGEC